jgi:hypothetical protein
VADIEFISLDEVVKFIALISIRSLFMTYTKGGGV